MSSACDGFAVSGYVWFSILAWSVPTALFLVWPRTLQRQYARMAARFPRIAAFDPGRRVMSEERWLWLLRLMGVASLAVLVLLLFLGACSVLGRAGVPP